MSLAKNFAYNSAYRLLLVITPLVTTPYLARVLGSDGVGVYSYTYSIAEYFVLFATLGMSNYGVRAIAMYKQDDKKTLSRFFSSIYYSQVTIAVLVIAAYLIFSYVVCGENMRLFMILWTFWVVSAALDVSWFFFGIEDFKMPTIRSIAVKIIELVAIFAFVKNADDVWVYILIISLGYFLTQASLWLFLGRHVKLTRVSLKEIVIHFKPNLILFLPVIAIGIFTTMNRVLLGVLSTMSQVGFFDYSEKICKMPKAVITALGTVMLPRMSLLLSKGKREEGLLLIRRTVWLMLGIGILMGFGVATIAPEFAPVFLGEEFARCADMIIIIAAILPLSILSNIIGKQYLLPSMREKQYTLTAVYGVAADLILCLILVPEYGAYGACVASVVGELTIASSQLFYVRKELPIGAYLKQVVPFVVIGSIMAVGVRGSVWLLSDIFGVGMILLILEILIGIVIALVLCVAYFAKTGNENYAFIMNKLKKILGKKA